MDRRARNKFGEWLDVTMSNKRMMGRTLAEAAGVHDSAVSRWRSGAGVPGAETLARIAEALGVDPLRLAVTAGQIPEKVAGVAPLPTPEPTAQRESVRRQIASIKGLTERSRGKLLRAYDETIAEEGK
jgi:transcriptional regulator with XRE-family HTH domain